MAQLGAAGGDPPRRDRAPWRLIRRASSRDATPESASTRARAALGRYADGAAFTWRVDTDVVQLRVRVQNPSLLPPVFKRALRIDTVDQTVRVRVERVR